MAMLPLTPGDP